MRFIFPKLIFNVERWKWNKEYRIYVSNMGHFRDEYKRPIPVKINNQGYVWINGYLAHRLVMLTWCPIPGAERLTVDHLDHNKRNNAVSNLEWVTRAENCRRAERDYIDENRKKKVEEEIVIVNNFYIPITINLSATPNKIICTNFNKSFDTPLEAAEWVLTKSRDLKNSKLPIETIAESIQRKAEANSDYAKFHWTTSHLQDKAKNYKVECSNGKVFDSLEDAVDWLIKKKPSLVKNSNNKRVITRQMIRSIDENIKYAGYKWTYVGTCGDQVGSAN